LNWEFGYLFRTAFGMKAWTGNFSLVAVVLAILVVDLFAVTLYSHGKTQPNSTPI
jgi:hypothetical protein